jgi:hypothetical protein
MNKTKNINLLSKICLQRYNAYPSGVSRKNFRILTDQILDDFSIKVLKVSPQDQTTPWSSETGQQYEKFLLSAYRNKWYVKKA